MYVNGKAAASNCVELQTMIHAQGVQFLLKCVPHTLV